MAKIQTGQPIDIQLMSQAEAKVGDYKWSHLETVPFGDEHLGEWMLCDGQSAAGTAFATLTGETVVPNALADGTFIRQAKGGRAKGSFEADKTAKNGLSASSNSTGSHSHFTNANDAPNLYPLNTSYPMANGIPGLAGFRYSTSAATVGRSSTAGGHAHTITMGAGDAETSPKNIALNLYVKVNY